MTNLVKPNLTESMPKKAPVSLKVTGMSGGTGTPFSRGKTLLYLAVQKTGHRTDVHWRDLFTAVIEGCPFIATLNCSGNHKAAVRPTTYSQTGIALGFTGVLTPYESSLLFPIDLWVNCE